MVNQFGISCKEIQRYAKEVDLIEPYLKAKKTFYDIPAEIVEEYGKADVVATEQVALKQLEAFGLTFEDLYERDTETVI